VRLNGAAVDSSEAVRWVQAAGMTIVRERNQHVDVEVSLAREGNFTRHCDCRVVIASSAAGQTSFATRHADVVLSANGSLGREHQVRLPLTEIASFYAAIGYADPLAQLTSREPSPARGKWAA